MAFSRLEVLDDVVDIQARLQEFEGWSSDLGPDNHAFLTRTEGGILQFAGIVYPNTPLIELWSKYEFRGSDGKGPHFDLMADYVEADDCWISIFNLTGEAKVRTALLPKHLAEHYEQRYPDPDGSAYEARRHLGALALDGEVNTVLEGIMAPNMGFVLPLRSNGQYVVHDVTPINGDKTGSFIKLFHASGSPNIQERLRTYETQPLDELITQKFMPDVVTFMTPGIVGPFEDDEEAVPSFVVEQQDRDHGIALDTRPQPSFQPPSRRCPAGID